MRTFELVGAVQAGRVQSHGRRGAEAGGGSGKTYGAHAGNGQQWEREKGAHVCAAQPVRGGSTAGRRWEILEGRTARGGRLSMWRLAMGK